MTNGAGHFDWVRRLGRAWLIAVLVFLGLCVIATVAKGVYIALEQNDWLNKTIPWALLALAELVVALWVAALYGMLHVSIDNQSAINDIRGSLGRLETLLDSHTTSLRSLVELGQLTDQAKSLIYHEQEQEALRETIHSYLMRQDYDNAEAIIKGLEAKPEYANEIKVMRREVEETRQATVEEKLDTAVQRVLDIIERRDWGRAERETQRLLKLHGDKSKVAELPDKITTAKAQHKRSLLQEYGEAVRKNDVDHSIELLRELDNYLTPQEGAAMAESARGMFRAKLHNLGVQFAIQVTDQQWRQAVETGEEIIREFQNSRMAHEVRQKMDQLRQRAEETNN